MVIRVITASLYLFSKSHEAIYSFTQTPLPSNLDWTTIGTNRTPKRDQSCVQTKSLLVKSSIKFQPKGFALVIATTAISLYKGVFSHSLDLPTYSISTLISNYISPESRLIEFQSDFPRNKSEIHYGPFNARVNDAYKYISIALQNNPPPLILCLRKLGRLMQHFQIAPLTHNLLWKATDGESLSLPYPLDWLGVYSCEDPSSKEEVEEDVTSSTSAHHQESWNVFIEENEGVKITLKRQTWTELDTSFELNAKSLLQLLLAFTSPAYRPDIGVITLIHS